MKRVVTVMIFASSFLLPGCDVRKKDKIAIAPNSVPGQQKENLSPTTVQIIDSVYNFGQVAEGKIVEYSYHFKNTGKNPLIIEDAHASCGCTVPEKPEHPIKPGEIGFIKVTFNSEKRPGQAHKTITVTSNAEPTFPILLLEGEVIGNKE